MYKSLLLIIITAIIIISCDKWLCDSDNSNNNIKDSTDFVDSLRFYPLDQPIEGKIYFVAGPNSFLEFDTLYNNMPWDFWVLDGNEFTKLNEMSWPYSWSGYWNYQFSPKANYFSFFNDKGGDVANTDDIGLLNLSNFNEYYFTDSLGDANPSDNWLYQWSLDEEYIYFNSIQYGVSEYDTLANSDLYRVTPNNYLEQLTDTPYFEVGVQPSPDGKYLAYVIENRNATPEDKVGIYLMDLETKQSEMIINQNEYDSQTTNWVQIGNEIFWLSNSESFILNVWKEGENQFYLFNITEKSLSQLYFNEFEYFNKLTLIPNSNKIILFGGAETFDQNSGYIWRSIVLIYDLDTSEKINLADYIDYNIDIGSGLGIPAFSPDGKYMAFITSDANGVSVEDRYHWPYYNLMTDIYIMDMSDYTTTKITNGLYGYEGYLRWVE